MCELLLAAPASLYCGSLTTSGRHKQRSVTTGLRRAPGLSPCGAMRRSCDDSHILLRMMGPVNSRRVSS